jgi:hypothetical protein
VTFSFRSSLHDLPPLAMQKVESSSLFSRFARKPCTSLGFRRCGMVSHRPGGASHALSPHHEERTMHDDPTSDDLNRLIEEDPEGGQWLTPRDDIETILEVSVDPSTLSSPGLDGG